MCIVGGKLRVNCVARRKQAARAGKVGDIGGLFAGKDRVTFKTHLLCVFDLTIPVGPFNQSNRYQIALLIG